MGIEKIDASTAWENLRSNSNSRWPTRSESNRLYPVASPKSAPKFSIAENDKVFCIGSCFAREIEQALGRLGMTVLSIIRDLPKSPRRVNADAGMFNKYTIPSILNEINLVSGETVFNDDGKFFIESEEGLYEDYQLAGPNYSDKLFQATEFRSAFNERFSSIRDADVIVLTLGLSEAWFDQEAALYLNVAPSRGVINKYPSRFELHVLDYHETLLMLESLYATLKILVGEDLKLLVTVSPVPLLATFRNQDVLVANAYSKSVLRAAVEQFQNSRLDVSYFPSYEFVTLSNPVPVWSNEDFRHVDRFFVDYIMNSVLDEFFEPSEKQTQMATLAKASVLYRSKFFHEAEATLSPLLATPEAICVPGIFLRWGMVQRRLKNNNVAKKSYSKYLELCPWDENVQKIYASVF